eukprot:TRINITY_DN20400_c0_g2_i1.p1 TRINITY_DN20400_c0_g2~~TRINITY_DN20400_c0_g2_i1.p1  ORF type:complete len:241 (-),score=30.01 TRINITY_DN20400_c0_g2_i1:125-748(-)
MTSAISNIEDAIEKNVPICVHHPSFLSRTLSQRFPDVRTKRSPYNTGKKEIPGIRKYEDLVAGECAGVVTTNDGFKQYRRLEAANPRCNLHKVGPKLFQASGGWATRMDMHGKRRCTDFLMNVVSLILQEMKRDGTLQEIYDDWLQGIEGQNDCTRHVEEQGESQSLSLYDTGGIFCIHAFFSVTAVLLAMCTTSQRYENVSPMGEE